ncbi:putative bifunctional diguanylate cyclase/phosphodiesterase [Marinospirillum alkaliphilum]|uniref:PAS domain S-box-containing protein/diguanylate cyclase (GGDEF) domain-containing protein n=1 Tax=Marinospirillum alkaliphilum DSM 21637 TaxID=1122209 RepID=A0A1K1WZP6_9GAMM|nr:EAL domain-containing protein [Marinospirillum alkaliphilum]SFX42896.1 PAS domain S-box-containing protein/diguanylate cyclase (GGDEF) domain-containing protein [Marinospirillum alkaliphilum DSM 21637]
MSANNHHLPPMDADQLLQDVTAFREENARLKDLVEKLQGQLNVLELQVCELEADALIQEQLTGQDLQQSAALEALFQQAPVGLVVLDSHLDILAVNAFARQLLKINHDTGVRQNLRKYLKKESGLALLQQLSRNSNPEQQTSILMLNNGQLLEQHLAPHEAAGYFGPRTTYLLAVRNITPAELSSQSLFLANTVIEQMREAVCITDARGKIVRVNQAFCEITGYSSQEVIGQNPRMLNSGRHTLDFYRDLWEQIHHHGWWAGEIWNRRKNGEVYPEWLMISRIHDEMSGQTFYAGIFSDITDRKEHQEQLDRLAFYDSLTGLPNRTLMHQFLDVQISHARHRQGKLAVFFLDLDKFKEVNDHYGHAEGDHILREATQRIVALVRESDMACRIGGDEFVVILSGLQDEALAHNKAEELVKALSRSYETRKATHRLSASVGIALYPVHGDNSEDLLRRADAAMYQAKHKGRNTWELFNPDQEAQLVSSNEMVALMWQACQNPAELIELHYQPIRNARHPDKTQEFEALVRLRGEQQALIYPDQFIEIAEQKGVISALGLALFEKCCMDLTHYRIEKDQRICINLSPVQFRSGELLEKLSQIAARYQLPLSRFNFEVTETAMMQGLSQISETLDRLRDLGCQIFLDDFGTGFASLSILKSLPVDALKVDRSFIHELEHSEETRSLVRAMLAMAQALGLKTVIEGIETTWQLNWLQNHQADLLQGYLFSKPLPPHLAFKEQADESAGH